jgi:hypothetical protein
MARLDAEHGSQTLSRLALADVGEVCRQADDVAAPVASGEIRPPSGAQVDPKRTEMAVIPGWIERDKLAPFLATSWEPSLQEPRQYGKGGAVNPVKIHQAAPLRWPALAGAHRTDAFG